MALHSGAVCRGAGFDRRQPVEGPGDLVAEVVPGVDHVGHDLVAGPFRRLRPVVESGWRHGPRCRAQLGHGRAHLLDDGGGGDLGSLRLQVAPDPRFFLGHLRRV